MAAVSFSDQTNTADIDRYMMSTDNTIQGVRAGGRFNSSQIVTYADGTEWVVLTDKMKKRFCGYLYLQKALEEKGAKRIEAAENRMALHDRNVIYLSRYCGEEKIGFQDVFSYYDEFQALTEVGFTDTEGYANLRKLGEKVFVFDTEKSSFAPKVHEDIDAFQELHDQIRAKLEEKSDERESQSESA